MAARRPPPLPRVPPPPRKRDSDPLVEVRVTDSVPVRPAPTEPPTGKSNQTVTLYKTVLANFDSLNDPERTDLVELLSIYVSAPPSDRFALLQLARKFQFRR
jgi:hypothetical protein